MRMAKVVPLSTRTTTGIRIPNISLNCVPTCGLYNRMSCTSYTRFYLRIHVEHNLYMQFAQVQNMISLLSSHCYSLE